jgi:hypothetical protein
MAYPVLPTIFTWGTPHNYQARVNQSQHQDGVERYERLGINLVRGDIDVNVVIRNYPEVHVFLGERRGKPFRIAPENRFLGDPDSLYICREWSAPQSGPGGWRFSAKFEQVRVLNNGD